MEEHISQLTHWVNHLCGPAFLQLLRWLHIPPKDIEQPISEYFVMSLVVLAIGAVAALYLRSRLSVERPGGCQQVAELLLTNPLGFGIKDLLEENTGHEATKFIAFIGSISFLFYCPIFSVLYRLSPRPQAMRSCRLLVPFSPSFTSTGRVSVTTGWAII